MTFDRRVRYRTEDMDLTMGSAGTQILPDGKVLLEVKCAGAMPLWLVRFLSAEHIYKTSFSKYGTAYQQILARQLAPRGRHLSTLPSYAPAPVRVPALRRPRFADAQVAVA